MTTLKNILHNLRVSPASSHTPLPNAFHCPLYGTPPKIKSPWIAFFAGGGGAADSNAGSTGDGSAMDGHMWFGSEEPWMKLSHAPCRKSASRIR